MTTLINLVAVLGILNGSHWNGSHWNGSHWNGSHWNGSHWNAAPATAPADRPRPFVVQR